MNAIEIRHLYKSYGDTHVLRDFSCFFPSGETTAVMGPSGSGKTTLIRLILGLEKPDSGEIKFSDDVLTSCVFQEDRLIGHYSALKNLRLVMPERDDIPAKRLLTEMDLGSSIHKPVRELSGGMARRVAIARALLCGANTIIMDEPFKGLDEKTHDRLLETVRRHTQGKTLLLITHDVAEAQSFGAETVKLQLS